MTSQAVKKKGYSQIEIIVVIGILAMIFLLGTVVFGSFVRKDTILVETKKIQSLISEARVKSMAGFSLGGSQALNFGVYFENDRYFLFSGMVFNPGDQNNQSFLLPNTVTVKEISLPNQSVVFKKINGEVLDFNPSQNYLVVADKSSHEVQRIVINQLGTMEVEKL